jgi:D-sedoheptulose 7-phosphate isomerase
MQYSNFIKDISDLIFEIDKKEILQTKKLFLNVKKNKKKIILVGNGGNSSACSHVSIDLTKATKIRSINFNEPNLITCFANDYRHENWVTNALKFYADPGDIVVLLSASGSSINILNAADYCNNKKLILITLSGFSKNNKLRKKGLINFYVNSNNYNVVESVQLITLLEIVETLRKN